MERGGSGCWGRGGLDRGGGLGGGGCGWLPAVGQERAEGGGVQFGLLAQALDHVFQVGKHVDFVARARRGEAEQGGRRFAAPRAAGEQPVLASEHDGAQRLLGGIVVDVEWCSASSRLWNA